MGQNIATWIADTFGGDFGKILAVFLIALLPIVELRGAIIVAAVLGVPWPAAFAAGVLGNLLPMPFLLWFLDAIFNFMKKHNILKKLVIKLEEKAEKRKESVTRTAFWGLTFFVGVPLPGTGGWTGALIASVIKMPRKKSLASVTIGVLIAGIIVTVLVYGFKVAIKGITA